MLSVISTQSLTFVSQLADSCFTDGGIHCLFDRGVCGQRQGQGKERIEDKAGKTGEDQASDLHQVPVPPKLEPEPAEPAVPKGASPGARTGGSSQAETAL